MTCQKCTTLNKVLKSMKCDAISDQWTNNGSANGLLLLRPQAFTYTSIYLLSIIFGANFNKILIEIQPFQLR